MFLSGVLLISFSGASVYLTAGNKDGAMQQYYLLKQMNPDLEASLLKAIPK
jgi:hypothetical protein